MIVVCEPIVSEQEHVPVNSAFLSAIRLAFPQEDIKFLAEKKHLHFVEEQLETLDLLPVDYVPISPPARHASLPQRMLPDFGIVRRISRMVRAVNRPRIFFLSTDHNHLAALALLARTSLKDSLIRVVLHGGLSDVAEHRRNPIARALNLRHFLNAAAHRNLQFIVLEKWIIENLKKIHPRIAAHTTVVPHPLPVHEAPKQPNVLGLPIRIGFLGLATANKGFDQFVRLAADSRWKGDKRVEFELIGRLAPDGDLAAVAQALGQENFQERLSRSEYVSRLSNCHIVFVHLDQQHYGYSASGVLLDTVAWFKPILCGGSLLRDFFADYEGPVGYFCSPELAADTLEQIVKELDKAGYAARVQNLQAIASVRTMKSTASIIREIADCGMQG